MTAYGANSQPLEELRYALAEADAHRPPVALRPRVINGALSARRPGAAAGTEQPISASEAYRRTIQSFDAVLSDLTEEEWHRHAVRDLDIQGLVGHLIGVEKQLHAVLGIGSASSDNADHVASTQAEALAQAGRPTAETQAEWRELMEATQFYAEALAPADLERLVELYTFTVPVQRMLVVRTFETWIHEEDIRRATGRPLAAPDADRLRLMTNVAVTALPAGFGNIGRPQPGRTARIVLTGSGGGTWQASLDQDSDPGATEVRIIADATEFCRLVANRLPVADLDVDITGDAALAADLLVAAQSLALD